MQKIVSVEADHAEHFEIEHDEAVKLPQQVLAFVPGEAGRFGGEVVLGLGDVFFGFHF
jgi:hypothetical protein